MSANFAVLASPEDIFIDIYMVYEPDSEAQQNGRVIVQVIEEEVNGFFNEISKPGPISALNCENINLVRKKL